MNNWLRPIADGLLGKETMRLRILLLTCLLSVAGCLSSGQDIRPEQVAQIVKGKTTEADLVRMFGQPVARGVDNNGCRYLNWSRTQINDPWLVPLPVPQPIEQKALSVTLGPDGTVKDFYMSDASPPK